MQIKRIGAPAALAVAALALAACTTPAVDGGNQTVVETDVVTEVVEGQTEATATGEAPADAATPATPAEGTKTIAIGRDFPFFSMNNLTPNGNHTANSDILQFTTDNFYYFDDQLNLVENTDFGTITVVNEDPFTVEVHVNPGVVWSDGTPLDAADLMMAWGAQNDKFDTEVEMDEDGNPIIGDNQVFFTSSSSIMNGVTQTPTISEDGQTLTMVFDDPPSDWKMGIGAPPVAAHVLGRIALGIDDPQEAKDAVVAAFVDNDTAALSPISNTWNTAWNFTSLPSDPGLYLSSGPYVMSEFVEGQYAVLERNPLFTWDPARVPNIDQVTFRWVGDPLAQVQALQNGQVDIIGPQASVDTLVALQGLNGVTPVAFEDSAWEHVDLVLDNGGPFDPATYGGDEETARVVREAFLLTIPRQQIIDTLIRPLQDDAETRDSLIFAPGFPGYEEAVASNGIDNFGAGDQGERSCQMLEEAGVSTPVDVRFMFGDNNTRRVDQMQLMTAAASRGCFNIIEDGTPQWPSRLHDGSYDAALFAWVSTNPYLLNSRSTYETGGFNNHGGYSNERVDELWATIASTQDAAEEQAAGIEMDGILLHDAMSLPLFQHPGLLAYTDRLEGVVPMPIGPQWMWNFWNWDLAAQ